MDDPYENAPLPLETAYRTREPNAPFPLYSGKIRITRGSVVAEGDGTVEFRWFPTPRMHFVIPSVTTIRIGLEDCDLELLDRGWVGRGVIVGVGYGGVQGLVDHVAGGVGGGASEVAQLRLHLPNFMNTRGRPLRSTDGNGWYSGRILFDVPPWRITLDELDRDLLKKLKTAGGYAITHVVGCERLDGKTFDPESVEDFLLLMDTALSFCLGRWTGGVLATGVDTAGARIWERWRLPWLVPYASERSWTPPIPPDAFTRAISGLVRACEDETTHHSLRTSVHWYIEANAGHGGLEGALTMSLVALELLSWLGLVVRGGGDPLAFEKERAHNKVREYLTAQGIALGADSLRDLVAFVKDNGCADGLEAVTRIRNRTVHPPKGQFASYSIELREQAWRYVLNLLERAILAECGYRGPIMERLDGNMIDI